MDAVADGDMDIVVECAGQHVWHRELPTGDMARVVTFPEYMPPRR